jgi:hypothetical protein
MGIVTPFGTRTTTEEWTLSSYFGMLLSNIEPTPERVEIISDAHTTLREHLGSDAADLTYPVEDDFLSGSYARHTATGTVKDADIILPLQGAVLSNDRRSPSPRAVLQNLKQVVDLFYDHVDLEQQRRSIQVFLTEDDVRMDLVPAIAPDGVESVLYVPDYQQQLWIESHPKGHITGSSTHNTNTGGRYVPLVKLVKWWRDQHITEDKRPKSFLLECLVRETCPVEALPMAKMFKQTLEMIVERYGAVATVPVIADPALPGNDLAVSCSWTSTEFKAFIAACEEAITLADAALGATTKEEAIQNWRILFGDKFPESLTQEEIQRFSLRDTKNSIVVPQAPFRHTVSVRASLSSYRGGPVSEQYPARDGRELPKKRWIRFDLLSTTVPPDYQIRWRVQNNGKEAREARDLGHETFPGTTTQWEQTRYRGHHFMFCEIVKNGIVVARSHHRARIRGY